MKEKPTIFSSESVRAILDGRKTMTRRVIKPQPPKWFKAYWPPMEGDRIVDCHHTGESYELKCPYQIGNILRVKESILHYGNCYHRNSHYALVKYKADGQLVQVKLQDEPPRQKWWNTGKEYWQNSRFMYKWATRIWLEVTGIDVGMVQDISEKNAKAEGCDCSWLIFNRDNPKHNMRRKLIYEKYGTVAADTSTANEQSEFAYLWDSLNAKPKPSKTNPYTGISELCKVGYPWDNIRETTTITQKASKFYNCKVYIIGNPMVWVYKFKRINPQELGD